MPGPYHDPVGFPSLTSPARVETKAGPVGVVLVSGERGEVEFVVDQIPEGAFEIARLYLLGGSYRKGFQLLMNRRVGRHLTASLTATQLPGMAERGYFRYQWIAIELGDLSSRNSQDQLE